MDLWAPNWARQDVVLLQKLAHSCHFSNKEIGLGLDLAIFSAWWNCRAAQFVIKVYGYFGLYVLFLSVQYVFWCPVDAAGCSITSSFTCFWKILHLHTVLCACVCACSCFHYIVWTGSSKPQHEDIFAKWGHFGRSSQLQRSVWKLRYLDISLWWLRLG